MGKRWLLLPLAIAFAATFLATVHGYLVQRLVIDPGVAAPWRGIAIAAIALLGATLVAQPVGERLLGPPWSRWIAWPASLWMGVAFWLLLGLGGSDLLLWLAGSPALAAGDAGPDASASGQRAAVVCGLAFTAAAVALRTGLRPPPLRRVEIELARWPRALDGFRIAQISDIHIGPILDRRFAAELVERVNALDPDLVAVTGDLVDGAVRHLEEEVAPFAGLRARHGVFFVTGNHDHLSGAESWARHVAGLGLRVLRNERVEIRDGDAAFDLVGVDDHHGALISGRGGEDLDRALDGRDPARPAVLLAHDPSTFKRAAGRAIDLQLSGHTHGGQLWPFGYVVRLVIPFVAGRYRRGDAELYVSRGTGFWGPPMRLFAPAEITELVLRAPA